MRLTNLVYTFALVVTGMLVTGCYFETIDNFRLEVSEAPEVYGINRNLDKHSEIHRFHGRIGIEPEESIYLDIPEWTDSLNNPQGMITKGIYDFGGFRFECGWDVFYKWDLFVFGFGATISDDLHHHVSLGINTKYFEIGFFMGFFHQYSLLSYKDNDFKRTDIVKHFTETSLFEGMYVALFFGDMFLNYSFSKYTPGLRSAAISNPIPSIGTHYITLGYRFKDAYEIVGGAIISVVEDKQHTGAGLSVNFYPFEI